MMARAMSVWGSASRATSPSRSPCSSKTCWVVGFISASSTWKTAKNCRHANLVMRSVGNLTQANEISYLSVLGRRHPHVVEFHDGVRTVDVGPHRASRDGAAGAGAVVDGRAVQEGLEADGGGARNAELQGVPATRGQVGVDLRAGARVAGGEIAVLEQPQA